MALVLPVLILLVMATVDFGRAVYAYNTVAEAARNGARVAMVNQNVPDICAVATSRAVGLGSVGCLPVPTAGPGCSDPGCVTVTVTYRFTPLTPIIGSFFGPITLQSTSTVPIEHPCTGPGCPTT